MTMSSTMNITFTAGLPDDHGQYLFWLWDDTVVEAVLHRDDELGQVITYYNLAIPERPQRIVHRAETGKVKGWANLKQRSVR
jgi:hypothetical protein